MKIVLMIIILFLFGGIAPALALEHTQKNGLFSMDIPQEWRWNEFPGEIVITYPDGKNMAIDIQMVASRISSPQEIKKIIKDGNDKMIKQGIEAHNGTLLDNKEIKIDGVYATRLDFKTAESLQVAYISFFNKGYAVTITYGSSDDDIRAVMDDAVATLKFLPGYPGFRAGY